jgi:hypothetical protein
VVTIGTIYGRVPVSAYLSLLVYTGIVETVKSVPHHALDEFQVDHEPFYVVARYEMEWFPWVHHGSGRSHGAVSKQTVYKHFDDEETLFREVVTNVVWAGEGGNTHGRLLRRRGVD